MTTTQQAAVRSPDIRERFLHFFELRGHRRLASASLIPEPDAGVLFTIAGMLPLKPYLLGVRTPPSPRAASCQKCFRMDDIAEVGRTPRHHTFFEMLGNFSFGDYFKEGAIGLAWEFLTGELGLPAERLWPSVHPEDDEAYGLWTRSVGIPEPRMTRLEDNFWAAGPVGPCGYDSEVYFDRGTACSCGRSDCRPGCEGDRWVEIWNLVFMQYDRDAAGTRTPLPRPSIDTGMGLERIAAVLQGVSSNFETDLFAPIVTGLDRRSRGSLPDSDRRVSLRVCADHVRGAAFLLADGVLPANEGRGSALRGLIRRACVHARRLDLEGGLSPAVEDVIGVMGSAYPELGERRALVETTLRQEEEGFSRTMAAGLERLERQLEEAGGVLPGTAVFELQATYGLPVELTREVAAERGVSVDVAGYEAAMEEHRQRSRVAAGVPREQGQAFAGLPEPGRFVGYDTLETPATVTALLTRAGDRLDALEPGGGEALALLDVSPFYAEGGGQVGDAGTIHWAEGSAHVLDTRSLPGTDVRAHAVRVVEGRLRAGAAVLARVDGRRRARTARHHSATHLLHRALRDTLGEGVVQRGSYVGPDRATFDFNFPRALTDAELRTVQNRINSAIRDNLDRTVALLPIDQARASGAVALFEEKYGDVVRVVDFGGWSRELCGGTHVGRSGDVGAAILLSESSIGQGMRRIEMVAGEAAEETVTAMTAALRSAAQLLRVPPAEVPDRVAALQTQIRRLQRELEEARRRPGRAGADAVVEEVDGVRLAHQRVEEGDGGAVVEAVDALYAERLQGDGVAVVLGTGTVAVKAGGSARGAGVSAGELARVAAAATGGRGGGRPEFGRGGIGDPALRDAALGAIRERLRGGNGAGHATPR